MLSRQSGPSPLHSRHCTARAFSFTSFTSFASLTSSKPFRIRTSKTPLPQLLYNPHLQAPLGSAGNKGLITPSPRELTTCHSSLATGSSSFIFIHFQTLLHSPKTQPSCFHTNPRSLRKTPGGGGVASYRMVSISASRETWVAGNPLIENFCPPDSEK